MADRAKYIQLGVKNGITDLDVIRDTYNTYAEGGYIESGTRKNKYDGKSTPTQQMNRARVNYYDPITGKNYGSTMPSGKVIVDSFSDLTPVAQDEYMRNHPTTLDELVVTPDRDIDDIVSDVFSKENWDAHKEQAKEAASYLPWVGDVIDAYDAGESAYNGDYTDASLTLASLVLPNVIEKPLKKGYKFVRSLLGNSKVNNEVTERIIKAARNLDGNLEQVMEFLDLGINLKERELM